MHGPEFELQLQRYSNINLLEDDRLLLIGTFVEIELWFDHIIAIVALHLIYETWHCSSIGVVCW